MLSIFDSPLEQSGFELWGPTRRSLWGMGTFTAPRRGGLKPARSYRGTEGSNPSPSSGESRANLTFGGASHRRQAEMLSRAAVELTIFRPSASYAA
jgi:hypothetical protein